MSDTPRTDASWYYPASYDASEPVVKADFARQLERELAAGQEAFFKMKQERDRLKIELEHLRDSFAEDWSGDGLRLAESNSELRKSVKELQQRLIERTAAYEAKDAKQVRRIQELELGEFICKKCFLRKDSEHPKGDF